MPRLLPDNCPSNALSCIITMARTGEFIALEFACPFHQAELNGGKTRAAILASIRAAMSQKERARHTLAREFGLTKNGGEPSSSRVPFVSQAYVFLNSTAPADFPLPPAPYIRGDADGGYTAVSGRSAVALTTLRTVVAVDVAADTIARNAPTALLRVVR